MLSVEKQIFRAYLEMANAIAEWHPEGAIRYLKTYVKIPTTQDCLRHLNVCQDFLPLLSTDLVTLSWQEVNALVLLSRFLFVDRLTLIAELKTRGWDIAAAESLVDRFYRQRLLEVHVVCNRRYWRVASYLPIEKWKKAKKTVWISRIPWPRVLEKWESISPIVPCAAEYR